MLAGWVLYFAMSFLGYSLPKSIDVKTMISVVFHLISLGLPYYSIRQCHDCRYG